ncbi:hypothetical protein CTA1_11391 [Colletotrichum tanaceti]|uniref:Uncharacterized protein n=1 Tax=Colletotrichum tanaceti TaxID=1306861 RepID=A0A4U6XJS6_9PEZI|nr:hypothetical protein CTA1_11391 [Colletotrichum tanaceti]
MTLDLAAWNDQEASGPVPLHGERYPLEILVRRLAWYVGINVRKDVSYVIFRHRKLERLASRLFGPETKTHTVTSSDWHYWKRYQRSWGFKSTERMVSPRIIEEVQVSVQEGGGSETRFRLKTPSAGAVRHALAPVAVEDSDDDAEDPGDVVEDPGDVVEGPDYDTDDWEDDTDDGEGFSDFSTADG